MKKELIVVVIAVLAFCFLGCASDHKNLVSQTDLLSYLTREEADKVAATINGRVDEVENRVGTLEKKSTAFDERLEFLKKTGEQQNAALARRVTVVEERQASVPTAPPSLLEEMADLNGKMAKLNQRMDQLDEKIGRKIEAAPAPVPAPKPAAIPESVAKEFRNIKKDFGILKKSVNSAKEMAEHAEKISRQRFLMAAQAGQRFFLIGPFSGRSIELKKAQIEQVTTLKKKLESDNLVVIEIIGFKRPIDGQEQIEIAMSRAKNIQIKLGSFGNEAEIMAMGDTSEVKDEDVNDFVMVVTMPKAKPTIQSTTPPTPTPPTPVPTAKPWYKKSLGEVWPGCTPKK